MRNRAVVQTPVSLPAAVQIRASISVVVVLPLVPVIAAVGTRTGRSPTTMSKISAAMSRDGSASQCGRNPGWALTSQMTPPTSRQDRVMSVQRKSMPATSSPMIRAARSASAMLSG
jgi:hypothetical protein